MFGKIFDTVFSGSMFGSGPTVFAVWSYVIANAEPPGTVELNPKLLAACIGTSHEDVRRAIEFLLAPDPDSRNEEEEGRRLVHLGAFLYRVVSFAKYQEMRTREDRREYHREYWRKHRSVAALNNTQHDSTNSTPDSSLSTEVEVDREVDKESRARKPAKKGARMSEASLPDEWATFCRAERPDLNPARTFDRFRDYWQAQPGAKGVKLDWFATWRNWVRNERAEANGKPSPASQPLRGYV